MVVKLGFEFMRFEVKQVTLFVKLGAGLFFMWKCGMLYFEAHYEEPTLLKQPLCF